MQKSLGEGSGQIIDSIIDHTIIISKHNSLVGNSYIKLPKEVDDPRKGLINIQNIDDNECFKWCLVIYLNAEDHHPESIIKANNDLVKTFDFKDINFPFKPYLTT